MRTQTESFAGQPGTAMAAAREIASSRGWKVANETGNELEIKTKISAKSWGETIKVRVDWNGVNAGSVMVTVRSSARFQVYDWGKSADNVSEMMTGLRQRLQGVQGLQGMQAPAPMPAAAANQGTKFCANCGTKLPAAMQFCTSCGQRAD